MRRISVLSFTSVFALCLAASLARANTLHTAATVTSSYHAAGQLLSAPEASLPNPLHVREADLTQIAPAKVNLNDLIEPRAVTPEPASLALVGSGLLAIGLLLRKRLAAISV